MHNVSIISIDACRMNLLEYIESLRMTKVGSYITKFDVELASVSPIDHGSCLISAASFMANKPYTGVAVLRTIVAHKIGRL